MARKLLTALIRLSGEAAPVTETVRFSSLSLLLVLESGRQVYAERK